MYLIKQLMDARHGGGQQSGAGAASSPSVGESPHSGAGGTEHQHRILAGVRMGGGAGGADAKALLALDGRQRVRLLSLLVQLETQMLAVQARKPAPARVCPIDTVCRLRMVCRSWLIRGNLQNGS